MKPLPLRPLLFTFALSAFTFAGCASSGSPAAATVPELAAQPASVDAVAAARALITRVLPAHAGDFELALIDAGPGGRDVFEYAAGADGRIVLRGNGALSLAMAFNSYLRDVAHANFDWLAACPLAFTGSLPAPSEKVRRVCEAKERFFLNTCTYGYTMPFWDWTQWERFSDWMAMNGVNRPLAQAGQEAVWQEVWRSYGMTDDEIRAYFVGPAHLPWQRMANLDKWGGPLPQGYIDGQAKLNGALVARWRELGMKPILNAFAGHVPERLMALKPDAKITRIKPGWGGTDAQYATFFLDPTDPLFGDIQMRFLTRQEAKYGTDHLYSADPFNEMKPPSWEPDYLAAVGGTIYRSLAAADAGAVWYQMAWTFYYDRNWTAPRLKAMTDAVPKGRLVYLDYVCETFEMYRSASAKNFFGAPFIWNYLGNFGGNTYLTASVNSVSNKIGAALKEPGCLGVGSTLEGVNINPVIFDLTFDRPWRGDDFDLTRWIGSYADRRSGHGDPAVREAWTLLSKKVFLDNDAASGTKHCVFENRPGLAAPRKDARNPTVRYSNAELARAVDSLLGADGRSQQADGYRFDVVNLTRQAVVNVAYTYYNDMMAAYQRKDPAAFRAAAAKFTAAGHDVDAMLATRHEFLLGPWLSDARRWAVDAKEGDYYEHEAREIITSWDASGHRLNDYASRQWNGLIGTFYMARWEEFIRRVDAELAGGAKYDAKAYAAWVVKFTDEWKSRTGDGYPVSEQGDAVAAARAVFEKYRADLLP